MIGKAQFHFLLLQELFKAAGSINELSNNSLDVLRPFVNGKIIEGFEKNSVSKLGVELEGIATSNTNSSIFNQDCFELGCVDSSNPNNIKAFNLFKENGITTEVDSISDICYTKWNNNPNLPDKYKYEYISKKLHSQLPNSECALDSFNKKSFFIRGTPSINNEVYLADLGYLNPINNEVTIVEKNVSFFASSKKNVIKATGLKLIPAGIKVAFIKKITQTRIHSLGIVYGQLNSGFYFPHAELKSGRALTAQGQEIDLENLCLNLLLLTTFKQYYPIANQTIYRHKNYSAPELENVLIQSIATLTNLINPEPNIFNGSVPKTLTNYITRASEYNSAADDIYTYQSLSCFEPGCFEEFCFAQLENKSLIDRSIDNRALCWLVQTLAVYSVSYSNLKIVDDIVTICSYLLTQIDSVTGLIYKGWKDEELKDGYTNLIRDSELLCSTNCALVMALLKAFEITRDFIYLEKAVDIYTVVKKYFLTTENVFCHGYQIRTPSIESVTYQLLLTQVLEDYEYINQILNFLNPRLVTKIQQQNVKVKAENNVLIDDNNNTIIITSKAEVSLDDSNIFVPTIEDNINTPQETFKYNYFLYSSFISLKENFPISYFNNIADKYRSIYKDLSEQNRLKSTFIFSIGDLIENKSFLEIEATKFKSAIDFHNLEFNRELAFVTLINRIPTNYDWFEPQVLTKKTSLGKILYAIAGSFATVYGRETFLNRVASIDYMYGHLLNKKASNFGLTRFIKESDAALRQRIKQSILKRANTAAAIIDRLKLYDTQITIKDNYKSISAFEDINLTPFQDKWGEGFLQGNSLASNNMATLFANQPIEADVYLEIGKIKPAGIKLNLVENLTFDIDNSFISVRLTSIGGECYHLIDENSSNIKYESIVFEDEGFVCLETNSYPPKQLCDDLTIDLGNSLITEAGVVICKETEILN